MELKVVEKDEKKMILEVKGETVTLTNLLKSELWNDKAVSEAAQIKKHPYLDEPKVFVKVSRGDPKTALEKAADRIAEQAKEFREEFKKALKK